MKSNAMNTILNWVLATSIILSGWFFYRYSAQSRNLRTYEAQRQMEMAKYQNTRSSLNLLVNVVSEYSKKDPGVVPILESIGARPAKAPAAGGK
jgi:hypothetical protein